jgi:hypothetical protein
MVGGEHMGAFSSRKYHSIWDDKGGVLAFLRKHLVAGIALDKRDWAGIGCIRDGGYTGHSLLRFLPRNLHSSSSLSLTRDARIPLLFLISCILFLRSITLHSLLYYMLFSARSTCVTCQLAFYFVRTIKQLFVFICLI